MSHIITSDGVRIHFTEWGNHEGPTVLFLHGLGADNLGWLRQRHAFGTDFHCLAVDNRSGKVVLEQPGSKPERVISPGLKEFLDALTPRFPDSE